MRLLLRLLNPCTLVTASLGEYLALQVALGRGGRRLRDGWYAIFPLGGRVGGIANEVLVNEQSRRGNPPFGSGKRRDRRSVYTCNRCCTCYSTYFGDTAVNQRRVINDSRSELGVGLHFDGGVNEGIDVGLGIVCFGIDLTLYALNRVVFLQSVLLGLLLCLLARFSLRGLLGTILAPSLDLAPIAITRVSFLCALWETNLSSSSSSPPTESET